VRLSATWVSSAVQSVVAVIPLVDATTTESCDGPIPAAELLVWCLCVW
jgi:hypothetical protein